MLMKEVEYSVSSHSLKRTQSKNLNGVSVMSQDWRRSQTFLQSIVCQLTIRCPVECVFFRRDYVRVWLFSRNPSQIVCTILSINLSKA